MASSFEVFPLIDNRLPDYCYHLAKLPPCEFWLHKKNIADFLKLPQGLAHVPFDTLTCILACTKKGFGGKFKKLCWQQVLMEWAYPNKEIILEMLGGMEKAREFKVCHFE